MAISGDFVQRVFLMLSVVDFDSKTIVLHRVRRTIPNSVKILFHCLHFTDFPPVHVLEHTIRRRSSGAENSLDLLHGRFHL